MQPSLIGSEQSEDEAGRPAEMLHTIAASWQRALPLLSIAGAALWILLFRNDPMSEQALFAALLVIYFIHQIEEHLWPGGFRQFADAHLFHSGNDNWPVDIVGVALVNVGFVWLPVAAAALFPGPLRWIGLAWIGLTLFNGLIHVITTARLRIYNPGLVTGVVLFLPFTVLALMHEVSRGALSGTEVGLIVLAGILLHLPVAALFVVPYLRRRARQA
jgi:hypothetical protein